MKRIKCAYKAQDGTIFENLNECKLYELKMNEIQDAIIQSLLNSVRFAEISEINLNIFKPTFLNKVILTSADSIEMLNKKANNMNIIVIQSKERLDIDNIIYIIPDGEFKNILRKIKKEYKRKDKGRNNFVFYKINEEWYEAEELLNKTNKLYRSIAERSNFLLSN